MQSKEMTFERKKHQEIVRIKNSQIRQFSNQLKDIVKDIDQWNLIKFRIETFDLALSVFPACFSPLTL